MRRSETFLVVLALILLGSLLLISFFTPLERRVTAQSVESPAVLTAEELRIVDKEGNIRIRLSTKKRLSTIEILDESGIVVWKAPPQRLACRGTIEFCGALYENRGEPLGPDSPRTGPNHHPGRRFPLGGRVLRSERDSPLGTHQSYHR